MLWKELENTLISWLLYWHCSGMFLLGTGFWVHISCIHLILLSCVFCIINCLYFLSLCTVFFFFFFFFFSFSSFSSSILLQFFYFMLSFTLCFIWNLLKFSNSNVLILLINFLNAIPSFGYCLNGPESNPGGGWDFPHLSRSALEPTQPPYNGHRVFPGDKERQGVTLTPHPLLLP